MPPLESLIFPLILVLFAVPLFLQARKQKRAVQEQQKLQNSIATGDRVMTTSGLYGTVVETTDETIELEITDGITTSWVRAAIREKVNPEVAEAEEADEAAELEETPAEADDSAKAEPPAEEKAEQEKQEQKAN